MKKFFARVYSRNGRLLILAANVILILAAIFLYDSLKPPPQRLTQRDIDLAVGRTLQALPAKPSNAAAAYQVIQPSLVDIFVNDAGKGARGALGTGVAITDTGIILTCFHVIRDAARVRVIFAFDGSESDAQVIMRQPEKDLAVLKADSFPDDLKPATLVASSTLGLGDQVFAVGNPFGLLNSVSAGVVSGKGRSFTSKETGAALTDL
ncbi:MAG TPA: trypsin-like peptidase domain-containing protein, partial [Spirochaetia bacterium]|nr:trypsin-like peptidase domain-containing protein [Spirochaetia bacterium]